MRASSGQQTPWEELPQERHSAAPGDVSTAPGDAFCYNRSQSSITAEPESRQTAARAGGLGMAVANELLLRALCNVWMWLSLMGISLPCTVLVKTSPPKWAEFTCRALLLAQRAQTQHGIQWGIQVDHSPKQKKKSHRSVGFFQDLRRCRENYQANSDGPNQHLQHRCSQTLLQVWELPILPPSSTTNAGHTQGTFAAQGEENGHPAMPCYLCLLSPSCSTFHQPLTSFLSLYMSGQKPFLLHSRPQSYFYS